MQEMSDEFYDDLNRQEYLGFRYRKGGIQSDIFDFSVDKYRGMDASMMKQRLKRQITTPQQPRFFSEEPILYLVDFEKLEENSIKFNVTKEELKRYKGNKLLV